MRFFKRKSKAERLEDLVVKKQMMKEKAKEMEYKAELHSGIRKAKEKIKKSSPVFSAIDKFQKGAAKAARKMPKGSGYTLGGDLGMGGGMDIFGGEPPRQSRKKGKKRKRKIKKNPRYRSDPLGFDDWF